MLKETKVFGKLFCYNWSRGKAFMRYGLYFSFDESTEEALQKLREELARQVPGLPGIEGKMGPHLTMLIFDDSNQASVIERFQGLAGDLESFTLKLGEIAHFQGRRRVVYVEPVMPEKLRENYERCRTAYISSEIVPAYNDPVLWKPHVTLAKGIKSHGPFNKAKNIAEKIWNPVEARIRSFGLIDVQKPTEPLALKKL